MTYQEKFIQLRNDFAEASEKYLKAEKELTTGDGFFDKELIQNFEDSKRDFEITGNNYQNFLAIAKKNNSKPEDIFSL